MVVLGKDLLRLIKRDQKQAQNENECSESAEKHKAYWIQSYWGRLAPGRRQKLMGEMLIFGELEALWEIRWLWTNSASFKRHSMLGS